MMKKANILLVLLAAVATAGCGVAAHPWKDPMIAPGAKKAHHTEQSRQTPGGVAVSNTQAHPVALADQVQSFSDVELCQGIGKAQVTHNKAAYAVYSDEMEQRSRGRVFSLDQGACTALAVAEINKRNGSK